MPETRVLACEFCGRRSPVWMLSPCPICGRTVCQKCATFAYGRHFCSPRCGQFFFHGDATDEDDLEES